MCVCVCVYACRWIIINLKYECVGKGGGCVLAYIIIVMFYENLFFFSSLPRSPTGISYGTLQITQPLRLLIRYTYSDEFSIIIIIIITNNDDHTFIPLCIIILILSSLLLLGTCVLSGFLITTVRCVNTVWIFGRGTRRRFRNPFITITIIYYTKTTYTRRSF